MSWTYIDDHLMQHPKVLRLIGRYGADGVLALGFWVGLQAGPANTDGRFTAEVARWAFLDKVDPELLLPMLVEVGLVDEVDGGWAIHDFDHWHNPKRAAGIVRAEGAGRSPQGTFAPAERSAGDQQKRVLVPNGPSSPTVPSDRTVLSARTPARGTVLEGPKIDDDPRSFREIMSRLNGGNP
jgi:hypothetical protein